VSYGEDEISLGVSDVLCMLRWGRCDSVLIECVGVW